jgi:hypothetical protein
VIGHVSITRSAKDFVLDCKTKVLKSEVIPPKISPSLVALLIKASQLKGGTFYKSGMVW